ncbi:hypothetical protein AABB24_018612 [Solanum stoloniferum]|uniref:Uncharacterized protein n=1 Tax=Solanum stoloniferum TaxID=62892 RepID=A0ABD2TCI8_9SOLN
MLQSNKSEPKNAAAVRCKYSPEKGPSSLNLAHVSPSFSRTESRCQNLPSLSSLLFKSDGSPLISVGNGYKFQFATLSLQEILNFKFEFTQPPHPFSPQKQSENLIYLSLLHLHH